LTERYWETMLSKGLILGRAPKELVSLIGYNPVIEINWVDPEEQLKVILQNIEKYQALVDKNYEKAQFWGSWEQRMETIKKTMS